MDKYEESNYVIQYFLLFQILGLVLALSLCLTIISAAPFFFGNAVALVGADIVFSGAAGASVATVPIASILLAKALLIKKAIIVKALLDRQQQQQRGNRRG